MIDLTFVRLPVAPPDGSHTGADVTVCIPAYNEGGNLKLLLETISSERDVGTGIAQVLIEVSGSSDETPRIARDFQQVWPAIKVLDRSKRQGLASSVSQMILKARTDIVVRIDADVSFEPGMIRRLTNLLDDESVGMVGPRILPAASGMPLLDCVLRAEYTLHHLVCMESPKITNLQVFRRFGGSIPDDVETEDIALQDLATECGRRAVYSADEFAYIVPPASLGDFMQQRVRSITSERWYMQTPGRRPAPTMQLTIVARAGLSGIRSRELRPFELGVFLLMEALCRVYSKGRSFLFGHVDLSLWKSVR